MKRTTRIQTDERKQPSLKVLCQLAEALSLPQVELLNVAVYAPYDNTPAVERVFPGLRIAKDIYDYNGDCEQHEEHMIKYI